ncbi:hypothetical protein RQP53_18045 [Paucibacter sp. APW11]|uniref:Solute-binding protein family 3/N-terminal domain-containing protein n=1 Tax=Roseateles aquae TaxID=3077235 RepID=A0ABU3PF04_9BURK|nr:hypothetical protein [Paucibacter sp. APW11]MDT9001185.1 hypothetical protein [Paucibacter sp. APW11]
MRLCIPDHAVPPYVSEPGAEAGLSEQLLQHSAQAVGIALQLLRQPPARCRRSIENGQVDVAPMAASSTNLADYDFPLHEGQVDANRRLLRIQLVVVRRRGDALQWDGQHFEPATPLLGIRLGQVVFSDRLKQLGLRPDASAVQGEQLLRKLLARRVDAVLLFREEFEGLQARLPELAVEALPQPFMVADMYLGASRRLDAASRARVEAWWEQIGKWRDLPAYRPK